ncbi:cyclic di-GMP phosphodiesterase response regulator RpfG [Andreesenia angusta]|uniref:Cyclic di-GMP phosphodiesterase response regulator RpfG n=1 Tax=Andreesenia angusta TaxID=39480 RepID=A0A1S1V827_9FIRM|nr:HD domain-containing phosphohydrolase [Andreesenia angusta]OHW62307.1 cyclic di-GMP phosphodiesterase response regulator RpfG [Andreesenia angusta]
MQRRSKVFIYLRKRTIYIVLTILGIVGIVIATFLVYTEKNNNGQLLVNELGMQRARTQIMAKDANRISVLLDALEGYTEQEDMNRVEKKLEHTKRDLESNIVEYEDVVSGIEQGVVETEYGEIELYRENTEALVSEVSENRALWDEFKLNYSNIIQFDDDDEEFRESIIFINENVDRLMESSASITSIFLETNQEFHRSNMNKMLLMIASLAMVLVYTLYEFYKYLFLPLDQLYMGFKKIGLESSYEGNGFGVRAMSNEIGNMLDGIIKSMNLIEEINTNMSFDDSLKYIYNSFGMYIPYSYIGIALFKSKDSDILVGSYGIGKTKLSDNEMTGILGYEIPVGETSLKEIMRSGEARIINDLEEYLEGKKVKGYNRIVLDSGIKASITLPLVANDICLGFIFFSSDRKHVYNENHVRFLNVLSNSIAVSFQKNIFVEDLLYSSLLALTKISEEKDEDTGEHLGRMKRYSTTLAKLMKKSPVFMNKMDASFILDIEKFSPMHDIGKVGIPDRILLKPGKLDYEEFEIMKTHTVNGAQVLIEAEENLKKNGKEMFRMGIEIALTHHEKWDGSGYPEGLKGSQIPLAGRIVAVADVLDALLSKRPYKEPFSFEKSVEIILEGKGKHFDPDIIEVFESNLEIFRALSEKHIQMEEE